MTGERDMTLDRGGLASGEADKSSDELRLEVEQARDELAHTVAELSAGIDPRPRIEEAKHRAAETGKTAARYGIPAIALLAAIAGFFYWRNGGEWRS